MEDLLDTRASRQGRGDVGVGGIHEDGVAGHRTGGRNRHAVALHRGSRRADCANLGGLAPERTTRRCLRFSSRRYTMLTHLQKLRPGMLVLTGIFAASPVLPALAAERTSFDVAWSIYVGWMPWDYADRSGILKKWADKYGIKIKLTQVNEYVESINQYTAGTFDACAMTNMDALTIPAAGGVDSTVLIVGDFSNGNDGVVLKGKGKTLADIKGQKVNLVELSVSHYLLIRALGSMRLRERDITVVNTSDADIVAAFAAPATTAVVTWKPQLSAVLAAS